MLWFWTSSLIFNPFKRALLLKCIIILPVFMRHSVLVNSETAVSVAHGVFLGGRNMPHEKDMFLHWLSCLRKAGSERQQYFTGVRINPKWYLIDALTGKLNMYTLLSSPLNDLIPLWSLCHIWVCFAGYRQPVLLLYCGCISFQRHQFLSVD